MTPRTEAGRDLLRRWDYLLPEFGGRDIYHIGDSITAIEDEMAGEAVTVTARAIGEAAASAGADPEPPPWTHSEAMSGPCPGECGCNLYSPDADPADCGCDSYCTMDTSDWPKWSAGAGPEPHAATPRDTPDDPKGPCVVCQGEIVWDWRRGWEHGQHEDRAAFDAAINETFGMELEEITDDALDNAWARFRGAQGEPPQALDAPRLARALRVALDIYGWDLDGMAVTIADEYARLSKAPPE